MNFDHSPKARDYIQRTQAFVQNKVLPIEEEYFSQLTGGADHTQGNQPAIMESLKEQAKAEGLWNMFLPDEQWGAGTHTMRNTPPSPKLPAGAYCPRKHSTATPQTQATLKCCGNTVAKSKKNSG